MTGMPTKSLMRMFGPKGNPQARNLLEVIRHLQQSQGVRLELSPSWDPLKTQQQSGAAAQPACEALKSLQQFARVPVHRGRATVQVDGVAVTGFAEFVLPAEGHAIVAFRSDSRQLGGDFAEDLLIEGTAAEGAFRIHSPQCYTRPQAGGMNAGWSLISPSNRPVRIEYGSQRPVRRCRVLFNKFDYECGDAASTRGGFTRQGTPLQVELNGRQAEFRWRPDHDTLLSLVRAHVLSSASLTEFSFERHEGENDDDLIALALDVAAICTFAAGSPVGVAMLEMLGDDDAVIDASLPTLCGHTTDPMKSCRTFIFHVFFARRLEVM